VEFLLFLCVEFKKGAPKSEGKCGKQQPTPSQHQHTNPTVPPPLAASQMNGANARRRRHIDRSTIIPIMSTSNLLMAAVAAKFDRGGAVGRSILLWGGSRCNMNYESIPKLCGPRGFQLHPNRHINYHRHRPTQKSARAKPSLESNHQLTSVVPFSRGTLVRRIHISYWQTTIASLASTIGSNSIMERVKETYIIVDILY